MAWKTTLLSFIIALALATGPVATASSSSQPSTSTTSVSNCAQQPIAGAAAFSVPMVIENSGGPVFIVQLCIDRSGPYRFVVDSGAESTTIVPGLAKRLGLARIGKDQKTSGVGCNAVANQRKILDWSIGGVELSPEVVLSEPIDGLGGHGEPVGLLGAEILSRFGAVQFNFTSSRLVFPGPEGPAPTKTTQFEGPSKISVPQDLSSADARLVPLAVQIGSDFASAVTTVRFGRTTGYFLVDTGTSQSVVGRKLAQRAGLMLVSGQDNGSSVCGTFTNSVVRSGQWSVGGVRLRSALLALQDLPAGLDGIFGADQLARFRYATLDFDSGELLLGASR